MLISEYSVKRDEIFTYNSESVEISTKIRGIGSKRLIRMEWWQNKAAKCETTSVGHQKLVQFLEYCQISK